MANNSKKSSRTQSKKNSTKQPPNTKLPAAPPTPEELARTLLPLYQPIDLSAPPAHLEVINRKIRALKKKLRRIYDIEQAIQQGSKKVTKEQENVLAKKPSLERMLADFEEIKASVAQVDISVQLRLLLGVFFAAASTSSDALTGLSTLLLPPSCPSANYNPQQELQHACTIAQQYLSNSQELIFDQPPTTFTQLQDEVKEFLIPKEVSPPAKPQEIPKNEPVPAPVVEPEEVVIENTTLPSEESVKEPSTKVEKEKKASTDEEKKLKENKDVKKPNNRRGNRKSRGDKSHGDRGYSKRGRGKHDRGNSNDKSSKGTETKERDEKRTRGNNRGRGGRGRAGNNRNKTRDTPKEAPPTTK